jgi:hypothetical protein
VKQGPDINANTGNSQEAPLQVEASQELQDMAWRHTHLAHPKAGYCCLEQQHLAAYVLHRLEGCLQGWTSRTLDA